MVANGGFHFVPVDNAKRWRAESRPKSQRYAREARKHVMKDIGFARRKEKPVCLNHVELDQGSSSVSDVPNGRKENEPGHRPAALRPTFDRIETRHCLQAVAAQPFLQAETANFSIETAIREDADTCLPLLLKSPSSSSCDPFFKPPIPATPRMHFLLHTRKYRPLSACCKALGALTC